MKDPTSLEAVKRVQEIEVENCEEPVALGRSGQVYSVGTTAYDTQTESRVANGDRPAIDTSFSPDGTRLYSTSSGSISVLDLGSGRTRVFDASRDLWGIAAGRGGAIATGATTGEDVGAVVMWTDDFSPWGYLPRYFVGSGEEGGEDPVMALAFSGDGRHLATGSTLGWIVVWNIDPASWVKTACEIANRGLSPAEIGQLSNPKTADFRPTDPCKPSEGAS
jgi:WD40 repeat protein